MMVSADGKRRGVVNDDDVYYYRLLGTVPETDVLVVTHKRNM